MSIPVFLLQYADNVIVLEDGRIVETGSLNSLKTPNSYIQELKAASAAFAVSGSGSDSDVKVEESSLHLDKMDETFAEEELHDQDSYDGLNRQEGDFSIYSYYASSSGRITFVSSVIVALLWAFCREFTSTFFSITHTQKIPNTNECTAVWLDLWTAANAKSANSNIAMYLGIYIFLGVVSIIFMVIVSW